MPQLAQVLARHVPQFHAVSSRADMVPEPPHRSKGSEELAHGKRWHTVLSDLLCMLWAVRFIFLQKNSCTVGLDRVRPWANRVDLMGRVGVGVGLEG